MGGLAAAAGITVRALHHYDGLGLVRPTDRTEAGRRRYAPQDVARPYRVLALRHLGVRLDEITTILAAEDSEALTETVARQLSMVRRQLADLERLRNRLARLLDQLRSVGQPSAHTLDDLMEAIGMTVHLTKIYTRTGDDGQTHVGDGTRVDKASSVVETVGDVDELNAQLGVVLSSATMPGRQAGWLRQIQNDLFDVGADLCVLANPKDLLFILGRAIDPASVDLWQPTLARP